MCHYIAAESSFMTISADAHIQSLVLVVKMVTLLDACTAEEQRFVVRFFFFLDKRTCLRWEIFVS
jgi:hypothetical protein